VPGLATHFAGVADDVFPAAPALSRWLGRAEREPFAVADMEQAALALFDVAHAGHSPPVAPFRYLADTGCPPAGCCWCVDPVHLRADTHGLILFDASTCRLSAQERQALFVTLRDFLSETDWRLETSDSHNWYLHGLAHDQLHTALLSRVLGKPVSEYLPRGRAAAQWMQRSNEMQMLLHSHPVNQERAARGLPAVNSVWISGGGLLPEPRRAAFDQVYSDDPLLRGLALWSGAATDSLPRDADALQQNPAAGRRVLLAPDACLPAAAYGDVQQWSEVVARYERDWFAPLLQALSGRRLQALELIALNGYRYRLGRRDLWRFWRRPVRWRDAISVSSTPST
jgi:hypothetical protein